MPIDEILSLYLEELENDILKILLKIYKIIKLGKILQKLIAWKT